MGAECKLDEAESEGLSHPLLDIGHIIQPRTAIGGSDKADEALNAHFVEHTSQCGGETRQGVDLTHNPMDLQRSRYGTPVESMSRHLEMGAIVIDFIQVYLIGAQGITHLQDGKTGFPQ